MKKFRFIDIYYLFPVFLLGLTASPNIVGWRIGTVILVSLILAVPSTNYFSARALEVQKKPSRIKVLDFVFVILLGLLIWQSIKVSPEYTAAVLAFVLIYTLIGQPNKDSRYKVILSLVIGLIFWSGIYLGLNQYTINKLFRLSLLEYLIVGSILFAYLNRITTAFIISGESNWEAFFSHDYKQVGILYRLLLLVFVIFLWRYFQIEHLVMFIVSQLPVVYSFFLLNKPVQGKNQDATIIKLKVFRQVSVVSLNVFLVYLFLDSTQVLQAVMGGY